MIAPNPIGVGGCAADLCGAEMQYAVKNRASY